MGENVTINVICDERNVICGQITIWGLNEREFYGECAKCGYFDEINTCPWLKCIIPGWKNVLILQWRERFVSNRYEWKMYTKMPSYLN